MIWKEWFCADVK